MIHKVPIHLGFNFILPSDQIGWVEIDLEYASQFHKMELSPGYIQPKNSDESELIHFGLIPRKIICKSNPRK